MNTRASAAIMLLLFAGLSGCFDDPEPIFSLDEVRYWFEDDLLVINVTITNQADFIPGPPNSPNPKLYVEIFEWAKKENPDEGPGGDLEWPKNGRHGTMSISFATKINEPRRERYYESDQRNIWKKYDTRGPPAWLGPIEIKPGESVSIEFATIPVNKYLNGDGYYTLKFGTVALNLKGEGADFRIDSGCFNYNTREFFGVSQSGPDCVYYGTDRFGDTIWTDRAYHRGIDYYTKGEPVMIYDSPEERE